jgi:hypothetical protein
MSQRRYELSDFEWSIIAPLLPNKPRGVPRNYGDSAHNSPITVTVHIILRAFSHEISSPTAFTWQIGRKMIRS